MHSQYYKRFSYHKSSFQLRAVYTGIGVVRESEVTNLKTGEMQQCSDVIKLIELEHRGRQISEKLTARRQMRRRRRSQLRYRAPRFLNRGNKQKGWLAPSLQHRVDTTMSWVERLCNLVPVKQLTQELVRFDMQKIANPEISGVEYQQGTLLGYELREYLLEKWQRKCAYCDAKDVPLQIEHIHPKAKGGTNKVNNLTLACQKCNQKKGSIDIKQFLSKDTARFNRIIANTTKFLKDASAVNSTRWALFNRLKVIGLSVITGSGGLTKYNRGRLGIPKTHALDAICVGKVDVITDWLQPTLLVKATGRGQYKRTLLDAYGFPRGYLTRNKCIKGFQTGDMVKAVVPSGKNIGVYIGRVAIRKVGSFDIKTSLGLVQSISHKYCTRIQCADGYGYLTRDANVDCIPASTHYIAIYSETF
ncbi:MAG: HNH endonuclease [Burkholderiales bacterium]|nr:HNH endonuclease [Burkholderiales bacterium]